MAAPTFIAPGSRDALHTALAAFLSEHSAAAIAARGAFLIAVSGGSQTQILAGALAFAAASALDLQTERWVVVFADERLVPHDDAASNAGALASLASAWRARIVPVDTALPLAAAAAAYEEALARELALTGGALDVALLGCGPDGHTASLFPGHALLKVDRVGVAALDDSPKAPPARVTLTLPMLCAARAVAFIALGADKGDVIARVARGDKSLPAACVTADGGRKAPVWYVDARPLM